MGRKRRSVEQIITKLREAEIEQARGATVAETFFHQGNCLVIAVKPEGFVSPVK